MVRLLTPPGTFGRSGSVGSPATYRARCGRSALRAVGTPLGLLHKLTFTPQEVGPRDVRAVLDAGVSPAATRDAIYLCALFNTINRVADGLDFELPTTNELRLSTRLLLRLGYR